MCTDTVGRLCSTNSTEKKTLLAMKVAHSLSTGPECLRSHHIMVRVKITVMLGCFLVFGSAASQQNRLKVDLYSEKSIGGVDSFDRNVFVNMHYTLFNGNLDDEETKYLFGDLDINAGRFAGGPLKSYRENLDPDELIESGARWRSYVNSTGGLQDVRSYQTKDIIVFDSNRAFDDVGKELHAYAAFAPNYFKAMYNPEEGAPYPRYYEPINEPFVHAMLKYRDPHQAMQNMSRMIDMVCRSMKASDLKDSILVGGYTAAWVTYEGRSFDIWEERMKMFLDSAGECIDFIGIHPYDIAGGKLDAVLDIIDSYNYMQQGRTKPFVISEFGSTSKHWYDKHTFVSEPYTPSRDWRILSQCAQMLMQFINRPDRILKAVPFIVGRPEGTSESVLNPYPWAIRYQVSKDTFAWSHLRKLFQMLEGVQGEFRSVDYHDPDLVAHVVANGTTAFLLVVNHSPKRTIDLNVDYIDSLPRTKRITVRRLFLTARPSTQNERKQHLTRFGTPSLSIDTVPSLDRLRVRSEEFVVAQYDFVWTPVILRRTVVSQYFAKQYLQPIEKQREIIFSFENVQTGPGRARLRLSISRPRTRSPYGVLLFNRELIQHDAKFAGATPEDYVYWGVQRVHIPMDLVEEKNELSLTFPLGGGHVSSCVLELERSVSYVPTAKDDGGSQQHDEELVNQTIGVITNGNFELGNFGWDFYGGAYVKEDTNGFNSRSAYLPGKESRFQQVIRVKKGATYVISARAKVKDDGDELRLVVHNKRDHVKTVLCRSKAWSQLSTEIATENESEFLISFHTSADNAGYVDAVSLRETTSTEEVSFRSPVGKIPVDKPLLIEISYAATRNRDVRLVLLSSTHKHVAGHTLRVGPGRGTLQFALYPRKNLQRNTLYRLRIDLRARGGDWLTKVTYTSIPIWTVSHRRK